MFCTIVIATYNSKLHDLERLIASLDSQTSGASEYEVIFVDDGSTEGTPKLLEGLTKDRSNFKVFEIKNSGWPSKPRNIGVENASGEFVLFMDHDDVLFPEIIERAQDLNRKKKIDVISLREIRTNNWGYGSLEEFGEIVNGRDLGIKCLLPMSPHKFYRTNFLRENNIKFIEGNRVMWEDLYFNVAVYAAGAEVGIIDNYPGYHWTNNDSNSSDTYRSSLNERHENLHKVMDFISKASISPEDRYFMLRHWFGSRVLGDLGDYFLEMESSEKNALVKNVKDFADKYLADSMIDEFGPVNHRRAYIIRNFKHPKSGLRALAKSLKSLRAVTKVEKSEWLEGKLQIDLRFNLSREIGRYYLVRRKKGVFFPVHGIWFSRSAKDLRVAESWNGLNSIIIIRGRSDRQVWRLPNDLTIQDVPKSRWRNRPLDVISWSLDFVEFLRRIPNTTQPWDFATRTDLLLHDSHFLVHDSHFAIRAVKDLEPSAAFINGFELVAYRNKAGNYSIDVSGNVKSILEIQLGNKITSNVCECLSTGESRIHFEVTNVHVWGTGNSNQNIRFVNGTSGEERNENLATSRLISDGSTLQMCLPKLELFSGPISVEFERNGKWRKCGEITPSGERYLFEFV